MGMFEFIIVLVGLGTFSGIVTSAMQLERQKVKLKLQGAGAETESLRVLVADMSGEIRTLKDRVRVLERLATDGDRNLAHEIERLRRDGSSPGAP